MNRALFATLPTILSLAIAPACTGDGPCNRNVVGDVCTIAGDGQEGYSGDGGPALKARFSLPMDTKVGPDGLLYIVDWNNHRIRKLTNDGKIEFVAGNGELGGSLDDPTNGNFNHPTGILFDPTGNLLYISAWHNSQILALDLTSGVINSWCGDGRRAYFGDEGAALHASLNLPASIAWSPAGELTIMDQANQVIRRVDSAGTIHRIAGECIVDAPPPGGPGPCAAGTQPTACPAPSGVSYCGAAAGWCMSACTPGYTGDGGPALNARMAQQFGQQADPGGRIAYDAAGNLFFADTSNQIIRKIDVTTGNVSVVAGTPTMNGYAGDGGPASAALLNHPTDLAFADDGTLYFTDVFNHCVRAIAPDQTISTVAGVCGEKGYRGDGWRAQTALFNRPYGIEWAPHELYIADSGNSVIRAVRLP